MALSYWEEYEVSHNNKGKSKREIERRLKILEESKKEKTSEKKRKK